MSPKQKDKELPEDCLNLNQHQTVKTQSQWIFISPISEALMNEAHDVMNSAALFRITFW